MLPSYRHWPALAIGIVLCLLAACDGPPESKGTADQPVAKQPMPPDSGGMTISEPPNVKHPPPDPDAPPVKPGEPQPRYLRLELGGLTMGASYDEVDKFIHSDGQPLIKGQWVDHKGGTGTVIVTPSKGGRLPADDYFFFAGKCAGYFKRFKMSDDDYVRLVGALAGTYDPGTVDPPAWAADDPIVKALPKLSGLSGRIFWQDEARGELLIIQREDPTSNSFCALFRPGDTTAIGIEYGDFTRAFEPEQTSKAVVK